MPVDLLCVWHTHLEKLYYYKQRVFLTLISVTSERPCQVRGGAPGAPPIYLGSGAKFSPKIMFPWKVPSIPTHLTLFQNFFSITPPKNSENWNSTEKLLKMVKIFKICNFWAISTCNTSKKRIFHIEFIFKQKKYDLFEKKSKKFKFFQFFFKIYTDQLASIANFSNLW